MSRKVVVVPKSKAEVAFQGVAIMATAFAGCAGFKYGIRAFDKLVPSLVEKVSVTANVAATLSGANKNKKEGSE